MDHPLRAALAPFGVERLRTSEDLVYVLDSEFRIRFLNDRYRATADESGHRSVLERYPVGADVRDAMEGAVRDHYESLFDQALGARAPVATNYVCPSPTEQSEHRCTIYPLGGHGLLLVHAELHRRNWTDDELDRLRDENTALLRLCSGCRRVCSPSGEWLYVPRMLEEVHSKVTHGLCEPCVAFYMGS